MKYTVVIRQPVPDEVRPHLEEQLVQRFGLTPELAVKLAGRRSGRLMKPTSQARAELLLDVFQSVGVTVSLEEVREEGEVQLAPARAPAPAADPFAAPDPFAPAAADPFAAVPITPVALTASAPTAASGTQAQEAQTTVISPVPAPSLSTAPSTPDKPSAGSAPAADDWADFAGSLKVPESGPSTKQTLVEDAPRTTTEFLTEVGDGPSTPQTRKSVAQQIRLGTLLPLGLAGLLTLLGLGLTLPQMQGRIIQRDAQTFASAIGMALGNNTSTLTNELSALARNPDVGFVRVELPNGKAMARSTITEDVAGLNTQLNGWAKGGKSAGTMRVAGNSYAVSRVSVVRGADGLLSSVPVGQEKGAPVVRRVMVGLSDATARSAVRTTLLLVFLTTLIGLGLALAFAARAARQIVGPLERLVEVADAISLGDLTRPVKMERNDEIGDLAQALERMRLSLEAAMDRLRRRKRM